MMSWNAEKLQALREKYAGGDSVTVFDPHFKEISEYIFGAGGYRPVGKRD